MRQGASTGKPRKKKLQVEPGRSISPQDLENDQDQANEGTVKVLNDPDEPGSEENLSELDEAEVETSESSEEDKP